jgi:hypothetical protein
MTAARFSSLERAAIDVLDELQRLFKFLGEVTPRSHCGASK